MTKRTRVLLMLVEVTETDERKTITIRPPEVDLEPDCLLKAFRPLLDEARRAS